MMPFLLIALRRYAALSLQQGGEAIDGSRLHPWQYLRVDIHRDRNALLQMEPYRLCNRK
jgi:hypothetical protein